jgi:phospholipase C
MAVAGVSHKYYYQNLPFLALWGTKYISSSALYAEFLVQAALGDLPAVSFVDPAYTLIDEGEGNDDHPHADLRAGEAFLGQVYRALTSGPKWKNTLLIVNRDEWGGFFDHIVPPRAIAPSDVDTDLVDGKALLGARVPVVVASPWSLGTPETPRVNTLVYDHTSVLKLIEWRWGLSPLTKRDASAQIHNLAYALNFNSPDYSVPALANVPAPTPSFCGGGGIFDNATPEEKNAREKTDSYDLLKSPLTKGWPLPPGLPE